MVPVAMVCMVVPAPYTGAGGVGLQVQIAPNGPNFYYAGGGGGGSWAPGTPPNAGNGGLGGGGGGSTSGPSTHVGIGGKIDPNFDNSGQNGTFGTENRGGAGADNTGGGGGGMVNPTIVLGQLKQVVVMVVLVLSSSHIPLDK